MRKKQDIIWEQSTLWESVEKWVTKYLNRYQHISNFLNWLYMNAE